VRVGSESECLDGKEAVAFNISMKKSPLYENRGAEFSGCSPLVIYFYMSRIST